MTHQIDFQAAEIQRRFIAKASDQQARLQNILDQFGGAPPPGVLDDLHRISHWLAGSAATFGFREISEAACAVETEIISQRSSAMADNIALRDLCNSLLSSIQSSFSRSAAGV